MGTGVGAAICMVGPFITSARLGIKSMKDCQTFLGRCCGSGVGSDGAVSSPGSACGAAVYSKQAAELS